MLIHYSLLKETLRNSSISEEIRTQGNKKISIYFPILPPPSISYCRHSPLKLLSPLESAGLLPSVRLRNTGLSL